MPLASLTPAGLSRFDFLAAQTDDGRIPDRLVCVLEEISSDGIDFARRRLVHRRIPPFQWTTLAQATTYEEAADRCRSYEAAVGLLATLTTTLAGTVKTYNQVMVLGVKPSILPGAPFGAGVTGTPAYSVRALWSLELTEVAA
jgi:hypothetical protein